MTDYDKVSEFVDKSLKNYYILDPEELKTFSTDEIKEALSLLLLKVKSREKELRELVQTLEERVRERTSELREKNRKLQQLAIRDELTKLYNRRFFNDKLNEYSLLAERFKHPLSCIMADIDHFKRFNDAYGHQAGDFVLFKFAENLLKNTRRTDICARYGGEEFVILLPNTTLRSAGKLAEKIRRRIESLKIRYEDQKLKITASFGVASGQRVSELGERLVRNADRNMYRAKQSGRNRVRLDE